MVRGGGHRTGGDAAAAADIYSLCVYYYMHWSTVPVPS
jgi:hypothetical protein